MACRFREVVKPRGFKMAYKRWQDDVYYTVQEVVKFLGFGEDWVRVRFRKLDAPLVLKSRSEKPNRKCRRDFVTMRILGQAITIIAAGLN